jgi:hypothetical protein
MKKDQASSLPTQGQTRFQPNTSSNRMKIFTGIALALLLATITYAGDPKPSRDMQKILNERFTATAALPTSGLQKLHYQDLVEIDKLATFEKYRVPHPDGADVVKYEIWRSKQTGGYLILKSGGEGGLLEVYGVGTPKK